MKHLFLKNKRKKGTSVLEFIGVLPLFVFMGWAVLQILFYTQSNVTLQNATREGAKVVAMDLRNYKGDTLPTDTTTKSRLINDMNVRMDAVTKFNGLLMLYHNQNGNVGYNNITVSYNNPSGCKTLDDQPNQTFICLFLVKNDSRTVYAGTFKRKEVHVYAKAKFHLTGSLMPNLIDRLYVKSTGTATIDGDGRSYYYNQ